MNNSEGVNLIDVKTNLRVDADTAHITSSQEIPTSFLDNIADARNATANARMGDMHRVASIPTLYVEKWMREGFNIFDRNVTVPEILKRLHREDMERLITTTKKIT